MSDAMKKTHNVVAVIGKYKDRQTGEDKNRYVICGSLFTREDGSMAIKMDTLPAGHDWNGWLNLYVPKPKDGQAAPPASQTGGNDEPELKDDKIDF